MQRKNGRLHARTRQRQKLSRRTVIIIAASCMTCLVIGFTIFFNMSHVEKTMAKQGPPVKEYIMEEQNYTDAMTLPAPVIVKRPTINGSTQMMKPVKEIMEQQVSISK